MDFLQGIFSNRILVSAGSGWIVAQIIKTIIYSIVHREFRAERLTGDGGMPSCHSSTVCALSTAAALTEGVTSPIFAVCMILAIIVMHDAMGVRLETGKQAKVINNIMEELRERGMQFIEMSPEERLKEFWHQPAGRLVRLRQSAW